MHVRVVAGAELDGQSGRGVRLGAEAATRLGVSPGAVIEFVNPHGAPLRAWVASLAAASGAGHSLVAELAPVALRMLAVADGSEVEVRALHTGVLTA